MNKIYLVFFVFVIAFTNQVNAQSTFSFSCAKDTLINSCVVSCLTIKTKIPDIRSSTNTYVLNPLSGPDGCFRNYVDPGLPGSPTSIDEDDTYSSLIAMP